jgi:hypothetical protein
MIADRVPLTINNKKKKKERKRERERERERERDNCFGTYAATVCFSSYCQDRK